MRGYIHVYTGNGKGKTTAALGLTLRAAGAGLKIFMGQFMKLGDYSELAGIKKLGPAVTIEQFGRKRWVRKPICPEDREVARRGLRRMAEIFTEDKYDIVVLDEINTALSLDLLTRDDLAALLAKKPPRTELVLTGRGAPSWLIDLADLVTEMREIKHYLKTAGVKARKGIEK